MNTNTFHQLYQRNASDVYRFAVWLSGNPAEAEEIAAETIEVRRRTNFKMTL